MLHNNNLTGNLRLGKKIYAASKARNLILRISIILTTILITVAINCVFTMDKIDKLLLEPKTDHNFSLYSGDTNINGERILGIGNYVESKEYKFINFQKENLYLKFTTYEDFKEKMKDKIILGNMPTKSNEILLPTWMISGENYDKDDNWRNIYFNTSTINKNKSDKIIKNKRIFKVVGYYDEPEIRNGKEYVEIYSLIDYDSTSIKSLVILFLIVTLISGYLLITNIFYTSVVKETRFYGILKTIGLGKSGMMFVIYYQGFLNYLTSLPFGLLLGWLLSKLFIPKLLGLTDLKNIKISPNGFEIYLISSIFILVVLYLCCNKPIRYIDKISPVVASKFIGSEKDITKTTIGYLKDNNVLSRIAMYNLFSNERKSFSTMISICISGITIILSMVYYLSFNVEEVVRNDVKTDFTLDAPLLGNSTEELKVLDKDILEKLKKLPFIEKIEESYNIVTSSKENKMAIQGIEVKNNSALKYNSSSEEEFFMFGSEDDLNKMISINSNDYIEFNNKQQNNSYFENNGVIAVNLPNDIKGKNIYLDFNIGGKTIKEEFLILDVIDEQPITGLIMSSSNYKKIFDSEPVLTSIKIFLEDSSYLKETNNAIMDIISHYGIENSIQFVSRYNILNDVEGKREGLFFVGVILSFFIGMIGFISIINSMLSSIISRNVEFALFESIGMTKKQQRKMLIFEGLNYSFYTSILLIPSSFLVNVFVLGNTRNNGEFNLILYILSLIFVILILELILISIPLICFKYLKKKTVVERIRESEII